MNRFFGRLACDGNLIVNVDQGTGSAENHLDCQVLMRGYIADRQELCATLGIAGNERPSDARLVAYAYRKWGSWLQAHVLGEYAAFVFDTQNKIALLTHDALGLATMFHASKLDGFCFATHLIDLLDDNVSETLDQEYFADLIALGYISSERTPFRSLKRLLPGMSLQWNMGRFRLLRTWDLARVEPRQCRDDGEYQERFRSLISSGVVAALDTPGSAWVALSGGLDSSSVACVGAKTSGHPLGAYSLVNPHSPEADEQKWMRAVVEHCGMAWHPVDVATVLPFSQLPDSFFAEPTGAVINMERLKVTNNLFASHNVTALLTGDGGDAILGTRPGPIPCHLADPLFSGDPLGSLRAVKAWASDCDETRSWTYWMLRAVVDPAVHHLRGLQVHTGHPLPLPPWIKPSYAREMRLLERGRRRLATRCHHPGRQQIWDTVWIGALSMAAIPATHLSYDVRTPLLYRPLVEFMFAIPWEVKLRNYCDRYLQRRALKGILPELVRKRASKAVGTWPFVEGIRRSKGWMDYLCDTPKITEFGIAHPDQWREAVRQAALGQTHGDRYFLTGVMIEAWLKGLSVWRSGRKV